jgi:hypothetical protein
VKPVRFDFAGYRDSEVGKSNSVTGKSLYSISAAGGDEKPLTTAKGLDDGPEYSPKDVLQAGGAKGKLAKLRRGAS